MTYIIASSLSKTSITEGHSGVKRLKVDRGARGHHQISYYIPEKAVTPIFFRWGGGVMESGRRIFEKDNRHYCYQGDARYQLRIPPRWEGGTRSSFPSQGVSITVRAPPVPDLRVTRPHEFRCIYLPC